MLKYQNHLAVLIWKTCVILRNDKDGQGFILPIPYKLYSLKYGANFPLIKKKE